MNTQDSNIFVLSLDALDLNLLPTRYNRSSEEISPIWTRANLDRRNDEYYEFQIKTKPAEDENKDKPRLKIEYTFCSICAIDVPKPFLSEHRESPRHNTNIMIADAAIERMKQYIRNTDFECVDVKSDPTAYFCPTCVTVLDCDEQDVHEKSLAHKNAMTVEKLFNDFLTLYNPNGHNNVQHQDNEVRTKKEEPSNDFFKAIAKPMDLVVNDQLKIETGKDNTNLTLEKYLALIKGRCENVPMFFKAIDNSEVEIETIDGGIVKIGVRNFHSISEIGTKHYQCIICREIFKAKHIEEHIMTNKHMDNLAIPLENKHCVREIDNGYHCLICNLVIDNSDFHLLCNKNHEMLLNNALVSDKVDENQLQSNENDNLCKEKLEKQRDGLLPAEKHTTDNNVHYTHKNNAYNDDDAQNDVSAVPDKVKDNKVKMAESNVEESNNKYLCGVCNVYISGFRRSRHESTSKHILNKKSEYHYFMQEQESGNKFTCTICGVEVPNCVATVRNHTMHAKHIIAYEDLLEFNSIKKIDTDTFSCDLCNKTFLIKNELIHIKSIEHRFHIGSTDSKEACQLTNNIEENDDEVAEVALDFYSCDVCNVKVPNYEGNIEEHVKGRIHTRNLEKQLDKINGDANEAIANIHYHFEPSEFSAILNCKVCNVNVLNEDVFITNHLGNARHINNYDKLFEKNFLMEKNGDSYCEICSVAVGYNGELLHIGGKKHKKNLAKRILEADADIDGKHKSIISKERITNGLDKPSTANGNPALSVVEGITPEIIVLLKVGKNPKEVICYLCDVTLPHNEYSVRTHINGRKHIIVHQEFFG